MARKHDKTLTQEEQDALAEERRNKRMKRVDDMSPELRRCVHEYGLTIVDACLNLGVKKPGQIRHLVTTIRNGSSEVGKRYDANQMSPGWGQRTS